MKNILKISIIALIITSSCSEDILDTHPYDLKVTGNFYQTPADAWEALCATYNILNWGYYDTYNVISEVMSDNCYGGCGAADDFRFQVWDDADGSLYNDPHDRLWPRYWYGIYRANLLLSKMDVIDWGTSESLKVQYTAECRFLRAHFYFELVKMFGNIPLLIEPADPSNLNIPQVEPAKVYKLIAEDLKFAIENLPGKAYSKADAATNGGRVTKWAAESYAARVYLYYTGYYNQPDLAGVFTKADVQKFVDDVINNSGHKLIAKYESLWNYSDGTALGKPNNFAGEDNEEGIFVIKYTYKGFGKAEQKNGAQWQIMIGVRTQKADVGKKMAPFGQGWGAATVDPRLWNSFETGDTRREGSINCWDSLKISSMLDISGSREFTGFNWKKYIPLTDSMGSRLVETLGGNYITDNYQDFYDIRFADVLLMGAELYLNDNISKAQAYYDMVRDRAFQDTNHRKTLSASNGKDLIFEERRHELALEANRYWDLLRYDGIAGNFTYAKNAIETTTPYEQHFRQETQGLIMMLSGQMKLNPSLKQNPGW